MERFMITPKMIQQLHKILPNIQEYAIQNLSLDDLHGIGHVKRVLSNAKRIFSIEGGEWDIIEALVWFHDIGRIYEKEREMNHALISSEMAAKWLETNKISNELIQFICEGIKAHSFSLGDTPESLESQILSDADKLDAIGAIGIFRTCAHQHENQNGVNAVLTHLDEKLLKLECLMHLPTSMDIAKLRTERLKQFKADLLEELEE
jgi:uncharacterized protein